MSLIERARRVVTYVDLNLTVFAFCLLFLHLGTNLNRLYCFRLNSQFCTWFSLQHFLLTTYIILKLEHILLLDPQLLIVSLYFGQ